MLFQKPKLVALIATFLLGVIAVTAQANSEISGTGIKLTIKEDLIESLKSKFLPEILTKLSNYTIEDQKFILNLKITKLNLAFKNIVIALNTTTITDENFQVTFTDPNKISLEISGIKGSISFEEFFDLGFLKEQSKVNADIYSFEIKIDLTLDQIASKQAKGKMLPLITLQNISVNSDFNYNLQGNWLVRIGNNKLIKGLVKKIIKSQINKMLSGSLKKKINESISITIANFPVSAIIDGKTLALDYEIISSPKIQNGKFFSLNSKALLFNTEIPQTLNPPFNLTADIPDFSDSGKSLELLISDYTVNSALYTLWLSGFLKINIDNSILPPEFPVKLNTTGLDILFNGVSAKYGADKPIEISVAMVENPVIKFSQENIDFNVNFECKVYVFINETEKEQAYRFKFTLDASTKLAVSENGHANVNVNYALLKNSLMIETTVEETYIENIENWINFASNVGLSYVNKNYLNELKIDIPVFKGVDLNNSTVVVKDNYLNLHITPKVDALKFLN